MGVKITRHLDVVSTWCYRAEPAWAELKQRYAKELPPGNQVLLRGTPEPHWIAPQPVRPHLR